MMANVLLLVLKATEYLENQRYFETWSVLAKPVF